MTHAYPTNWLGKYRVRQVATQFILEQELRDAGLTFWAIKDRTNLRETAEKWARYYNTVIE